MAEVVVFLWVAFEKVKDQFNQFHLIKFMTDLLLAGSYRYYNTRIMIKRKLLLVATLDRDLLCCTMCLALEHCLLLKRKCGVRRRRNEEIMRGWLREKCRSTIFPLCEINKLIAQMRLISTATLAAL